jgi:hypothetical protein
MIKSKYLEMTDARGDKTSSTWGYSLACRFGILVAECQNGDAAQFVPNNRAPLCVRGAGVLGGKSAPGDSGAA